MADDTRLRLLAILQKGEFTVRELTSVLAMRQPLVSHHLKVLHEAGIVSVKRQGTWGYYRLDRSQPLFDRLWREIEEEVGLVPEVVRDGSAVLRCLDERKQASREFFDRQARNWDDTLHKVLPLPDYRERLMGLLPSVAVALEVGCGTGSLVPDLLRKAPRVIGIDQSMEMIEQARRKIQEADLAGVDLRLGDMTHLPVGTREVELVVFNMVLHHAPHPGPVVAEAARVLKNGGALVLAELLPHEQEWVRDRLADQWLGLNPVEIQDLLVRNGLAPEHQELVRGRQGQLDVFILRARKGEGRIQSETLSLF
ncbi:MAG: ArsR family transcriptional regulator [Deltaproteobacteria bacterium]|nr:ArsR family transcriptional regulator [Deltaproteobacteria bacterium]